MKRILALLCIFVLIASIIVMLVAAIFNIPNATTIFIAAMAVNIILPVMLWVFLQTAEYFRKRGEKIRNEENNQ
jgi:ABC-type transport system involved in cytochrome bd biosynthesis fused ATPase/permease subunit